jgi:hypothetical protein
MDVVSDGSAAMPCDRHPTGINPRRDEDHSAVTCWLRLPSDGGEPHRNEESGLTLRVVECPASSGKLVGWHLIPVH